MIKNILYIVRKNSSKAFGGDVVQYLKTKEFLEKKYGLNIDVKEFQENIEKLVNYDIVHIWGHQTAELNFLKYLKKQNKKIIVSSIYWDFTDSILINYLYKIWYCMPIKFFKIIRKVIIWITSNILYNIIPAYVKRKNTLYLHKKNVIYKNEIISVSDVIIPNSNEEGMLLYKNCKTNVQNIKDKFISVPNAIDIDFIKNHKDTGFMYEIKDFIIEAARIEPLKNQLGLIKALMDYPNIPIIFAGSVEKNQDSYYKLVKNLSDKRGNVYFTGKISPEDLFSLYKRAKVHVLASFRESPGLATLEALTCGCQIVVSEEKYCPIKYYKFNQYGFVCNPYDIMSIKNAIFEAYNNPKDINLPEDYIKFFSYENVAAMTYDVYKKLLEK